MRVRRPLEGAFCDYDRRRQSDEGQLDRIRAQHTRQVQATLVETGYLRCARVSGAVSPEGKIRISVVMRLTLRAPGLIGLIARPVVVLEFDREGERRAHVKGDPLTLLRDQPVAVRTFPFGPRFGVVTTNQKTS